MTIKELKKYKEQIMMGMRVIAYGEDFQIYETKKYFKTYVDFIEKSENKDAYFKQAEYLIGLDPYPDHNKKVAYIYGRSAYLIARAIYEGREVKIDDPGGIAIDGELLKEPYRYPAEKGEKGFEEDIESLPNIEDNYYKE